MLARSSFFMCLPFGRGPRTWRDLRNKKTPRAAKGQGSVVAPAADGTPLCRFGMVPRRLRRAQSFRSPPARTYDIAVAGASFLCTRVGPTRREADRHGRRGGVE